MPCERYRQALIAAAAHGASASGATEPGSVLALPEGLREHVNSCEHCRVAWAGELALFSAIDAALHRQANPELPPAFLIRVQARFAREIAPKRPFIPAWAYALAVASLTFAIVAAQNWRHSRNQSPRESAASVARPGANSATIARNAGSSASPYTRESVHAAGRKPQVRSSLGADAQPLGILVPPGEEALLVRFYHTMRAVPDRTVLAAQSSDAGVQPLEIPAIEIARLQTENLSDSGGVSNE
jgi:hypothetical protein